MRGEQAYRSIIGNTDILAAGLTQAERKDRRDLKLANRFFYYSHHKRKLYEDILDALSEEFDLSPGYIVQRLATTMDTIDELKKSPPSIAALKRRFPHLSW